MPDACDEGIGGVLLQPGKIIACASRKLTESELSLSTFEKELLAVVESLDRWFYVWVHMRPTIVYTDHKPLTHGMNYKRGLRDKQLRLMERLLKHVFTMIYFPGRWNIFADVMSRIPIIEKATARVNCMKS